VNLAQMLTIIGHSTKYPILAAGASGYGENSNPWRLDPNTLKFTTLKGNLPYDNDVTKPQIGLLRYVLQQLYSKEMICTMLNLQKQRSAVLEEQIVWLVILAMERSEQQELSTSELKSDPNDSTPTHNQWLWLHLSSQLIYFVLFQCAAFPNIVNALHEKLASMSLRKGRDDLMWALLQYISGSIQRNALSNFLPVLKLFDILYDEKEPLPLPEVKLASSTKKISATCIYIHLLKKAQLENVALRPIPIALKKHYEFLQHLSTAQNTNLSIGEDYVVTLLCNAYSTNQEYFSRPMSALIDTILLTNKPPTQQPQQSLPVQFPISMVVLDSLTVHSKMSVIHCIVNNLMKQAENKSTIPNVTPSISPALIETYSRLLVYTEIESLGIKGFLSRLLPTVCKSNAWSILYTLLEMFSYRLFHIQAHYRAQLLTQLNTLSQNAHINVSSQLHLCFESTSLRLLTGLGSAEFQFQLTRFLTEPKNLASMVSDSSEELNRVLILTLSRSMIITGMENESTGSGNLGYLNDLLQVIMKNTPHNWSTHTKQSFPKVLVDFYANHSHPAEDKQQMKKLIEEEYRNWLSMANENDTIAYFSTTPTFLCLLFKMILENGEMNPIAYKILERIGSRTFSLQLRKLCDFLLFEVSYTKQVSKLVDAINDMIWKYNIFSIDRLVLCLALRTQEPTQENMPTAQVFVIQLLLIKSSQFRDRVMKFVEKNSPEYWKLSNYNEKHLTFHKEFPEKFVPCDEHYSTFFGNVCLRFLPVLDIVIHRYLEMSGEKSLESILKTLAMLYKFHDRPITYLYNTLFYYENKLRDRPSLKRLLVASIINALKDVREKNWALTEQYQLYTKNQPADEAGGVMKWSPDLSYYMGLVKRLIESELEMFLWFSC
jgi:mediator of RNA polymerase II transcription subunit 23